IARDLPEPSPMAAEILNARPYAFLDNAPLEERRTQAVYARRTSETNGSAGLGMLDVAAIEKVETEAWPQAMNADELHDAPMLFASCCAAAWKSVVQSRLTNWQTDSLCLSRKWTRRCWRLKRKVLSCAENFGRTRLNRNGATGDCWRESIDSRSIGCAPKFS